MTIFTVHMPVGAREPEAMAEKIRLIPETASFAAFLFGPFWLASHGAWRAATGFVLFMVTLLACQIALGLPGGALLATLLLIQFFIGLEGNQMARAAASRGRFEMVDVVNANGVEEAEHVALRRLIGAMNQRRPAASGFIKDNDLPGIGLFPGVGG